jgi:hypothetical protein
MHIQFPPVHIQFPLVQVSGTAIQIGGEHFKQLLPLACYNALAPSNERVTTLTELCRQEAAGRCPQAHLLLCACHSRNFLRHPRTGVRWWPPAVQLSISLQMSSLRHGPSAMITMWVSLFWRISR